LFSFAPPLELGEGEREREKKGRELKSSRYSAAFVCHVYLMDWHLIDDDTLGGSFKRRFYSLASSLLLSFSPTAKERERKREILRWKS
jgi:hypothetical protein